jgi:hypothetical protein
MNHVRPRFRSVLESFPAYRPGRVPSGQTGRSHKLSSNESPYGPLPLVAEAIAAAARGANRYPDHGAEALTEAIAERFGVPCEHVAVGCGSVGVTQQLPEAVSEPGTEVLYAWRSFEAYQTLADLADATSVQVPLEDERHDLEVMADAITSRTRIIFICNPNNPTGTVVRGGELDAFLDRVPEHCLVVLDEAYRSTSATRPYLTACSSTGTGRTLQCCAPLQGVRARRTARRVHDRARAGRDGGPEDDAAVHRQLRRAGRGDSVSDRRGGAVAPGRGHGQGAHPGPRGADFGGMDGAADRGQLRLASLARAPGFLSAPPRPTTTFWMSLAPTPPATKNRTKCTMTRKCTTLSWWGRLGQMCSRSAVVRGLRSGGGPRRGRSR